MTHLPSPQKHGGSSSRGLPQRGSPYNRVEHNIFLRMQMADPLSAQVACREPPNKPPASEGESIEGTAEKLGSVEEQERDRSKGEENKTAEHLSNIVYEKLKDTERKS